MKIPVANVTDDVPGAAPEGGNITVSGGILSIVDATPGAMRLLLLRGIVAQVLAAWRAMPSVAVDTLVTLPKGSRFVVSVFSRHAAGEVFVIRTFAEAALAGRLELDPEDVEVFERRDRAEWLQ